MLTSAPVEHVRVLEVIVAGPAMTPSNCPAAGRAADGYSPRGFPGTNLDNQSTDDPFLMLKGGMGYVRARSLENLQKNSYRQGST